MKKFSFKGSVSGSKSLWNRALLVQSFFPELQINGAGAAQDVLGLQLALQALAEGKSQFDCGEGGTTFRFLLARLSRESGDFFIRGTQRLLQRPHQELYQALSQLGCDVRPEAEGVALVARGWTLPDQLEVSLQVSSQYLSGLLLSAWGLRRPLTIKTELGIGSESYLEMTLHLLKSFGMQWERQGDEIRVPAGQTLQDNSYSVEPDMSSLFALAALAVADGKAEFQDFPAQSLQPDFEFVGLLESLGAQIHREGQSLIVEKSVLRSGQLNLRRTPDLFPVLSVLLAMGPGESILSGLETLAHKESNRIEKCKELLQKLGRQADWDGMQFRINGKPDRVFNQNFEFDPDQDHRMAMAAAVANQYGATIKIKNPEVVKKSFPNFWELL